MKKLLLGVALLALLPAIAGASPIFGEVWRVPGGLNSYAAFGGGLNGPWTPAVPDWDPDITFGADSYHFRNPAGNATLGAFLASGGATILTGGSSLFLTQVISTPYTAANPTASFFRFTANGFFQSGKSYHVNHDDGFYLLVNGVPFNFMKPDVEKTATFTWLGASGYYDYTMLYGEWNGNPAVLESNDLPVPEPASMLLLASGLLGAAAAARRRRAGK